MELIEMACTGNRGRSPVAELIGNNHLASIGAAADYNCISSGTAVDDIAKGTLSTQFMLNIITIAKGRDMYSASELAQLGVAARNSDEHTIKALYDKALNVFASEEEQFRSEVVVELGIEGTLKTGHDQTIMRPDTVLILPMAKSNLAQVKAIYDLGTVARTNQPIIEMLSAYATRSPGREVPNAFGKDKAAYTEGILTLVHDVPGAIDRYLREKRLL